LYCCTTCDTQTTTTRHKPAVIPRYLIAELNQLVVDISLHIKLCLTFPKLAYDADRHAAFTSCRRSSFAVWRYQHELTESTCCCIQPHFLSITPALDICHLCYTPTPQHVSFARLPQSSLPTSCPNCSRLPWFSACWLLCLELPPSSS